MVEEGKAALVEGGLHGNLCLLDNWIHEGLETNNMREDPKNGRKLN